MRPYNLNNIKIFKGENPIHDITNLSATGGNVYFQSHIAGVYNKNNWDEKNYEYFKQVLTALQEQHEITFKTFSELC